MLTLILKCNHSAQQSLQPTLQTPQECSEFRRSKHHTQIPLKKEIFMKNKNIFLISCRILYCISGEGFPILT